MKPLSHRRRSWFTVLPAAAVVLLAGCGGFHVLEKPIPETDKAVAATVKRVEDWGARLLANYKEANLNRKKQIGEVQDAQSLRDGITQAVLGLIAAWGGAAKIRCYMAKRKAASNAKAG